MFNVGIFQTTLESKKREITTKNISLLFYEMVSAVKIRHLMAKKYHLDKVLKFIMEEAFWISQNGYYMTI